MFWNSLLMIDVRKLTEQEITISVDVWLKFWLQPGLTLPHESIQPGHGAKNCRFSFIQPFNYNVLRGACDVE